MSGKRVPRKRNGKYKGPGAAACLVSYPGKLPWPGKFQGQGAGQCGSRGVIRESRWGATMQDLWTTVRTLSLTLSNTGAPGGC